MLVCAGPRTDRRAEAVAICIAHNLLEIFTANLKRDENIEDSKVRRVVPRFRLGLGGCSYCTNLRDHSGDLRQGVVDDVLWSFAGGIEGFVEGLAGGLADGDEYRGGGIGEGGVFGGEERQ